MKWSDSWLTDALTWTQMLQTIQWVTAMAQSSLPASLSLIIPTFSTIASRLTGYGGKRLPFLRTPNCCWGNHSLGSRLRSHINVFSSDFDYPLLFFCLPKCATERVKPVERKSVWSLERVYFWRSRGRARAASFLVFYCFLCTLEVDSEQEFTPDARAAFRLAAARCKHIRKDARTEHITWKRERVLNKNRS